MLNYKFTNNSIGSDNWCQLYCEDDLIWESEISWEYVEPVADELRAKGMNVEVEFVTDDEMDEVAA